MILYSKVLTTVFPLADLYTTFREHRRLKVFAHKGRCCVACGREGVLLLETVGKDGDRHVDLYTEDFIMITVDHIMPKKEARRAGWKREQIESLDNKQPMCDPCNNKKGHKILSVEDMDDLRARNGVPQKIVRPGAIFELAKSNLFNKELPSYVNASGYA